MNLASILKNHQQLTISFKLLQHFDFDLCDILLKIKDKRKCQRPFYLSKLKHTSNESKSRRHSRKVYYAVQISKEATNDNLSYCM